MKKRDIPYYDGLGLLFERMGSEGILACSLDPSGKPNPITLGWGSVGVIWGRPVFCVMVRPSRYTFRCIEETGDFSINVPPPDQPEWAKYCGTHSGGKVDKLKELGLTAVPSEFIRSPLIGECIRHFECRVIHKNDIQGSELIREVVSQYYPEGDLHRVYFGEILRSCGDA